MGTEAVYLLLVDPRELKQTAVWFPSPFPPNDYTDGNPVTVPFNYRLYAISQ